jgi:hypothetical protein
MKLYIRYKLDPNVGDYYYYTNHPYGNVCRSKIIAVYNDSFRTENHQMPLKRIVTSVLEYATLPRKVELIILRMQYQSYIKQS